MASLSFVLNFMKISQSFFENPLQRLNSSLTYPYVISKVNLNTRSKLCSTDNFWNTLRFQAIKCARSLVVVNLLVHETSNLLLKGRYLHVHNSYLRKLLHVGYVHKIEKSVRKW